MKNLNIPDFILYNSRLSSNDKLLLAFLVAYKTKIIIVSNGELVHELGLSSSTIERSLNKLASLQLIKISFDKSLNGSYKSRKITLMDPNFVLVQKLLDRRKRTLI